MKFFGGVRHGPGNKRLDFGDDPDHDREPVIFKGYIKRIVLSQFYLPGGSTSLGGGLCYQSPSSCCFCVSLRSEVTGQVYMSMWSAE